MVLGERFDCAQLIERKTLGFANDALDSMLADIQKAYE